MAADVYGMPTLVIAAPTPRPPTCRPATTTRTTRTFLTGERTGRRRLLQHREGHRPGDSRAVAYARYADLVWCETARADLDLPAASRAVHKVRPGKMLA